MAKQNRQMRAATRIRSIRSKLNEGKTREHLQIFLTEYFLCEMSCKEMIVGYKDSIGKEVKYEDVKMSLKDIKDALNHFGINVSNEVSKRLFSSDLSSAKKIRDSLVHGLSKKTIDKMNREYTQIVNDMNTFLSAVEG